MDERKKPSQRPMVANEAARILEFPFSTKLIDLIYDWALLYTGIKVCIDGKDYALDEYVDTIIAAHMSELGEVDEIDLQERTRYWIALARTIQGGYVQ